MQTLSAPFIAVRSIYSGLSELKVIKTLDKFSLFACLLWWDLRPPVRGYPETHQERYAYIKQHPYGNERQDGRTGQVY
jgi:hypothetical protein